MKCEVQNSLQERIEGADCGVRETSPPPQGKHDFIPLWLYSNQVTPIWPICPCGLLTPIAEVIENMGTSS